MKVVHQLTDVNAQAPVALTAGSFDGVHLGHQALIADALTRAKLAGGQAWLLTFTPHPAQLLAPSKAPKLLMTEEQRHAEFERLGLDGCIELPFGQELAETEAETFIAQLCDAVPTLHSLTVGPNWTFGYHARGNGELLKAMAASNDFTASILDPVQWKGQMISSSRIRQNISAGEMEEANGMLGRPYTLSGVVVKGRREGRKLGYPTANVQFNQECEPSAGIFGCTVPLNGQVYPGAGYFMHPPEGKRPFFEVHLMGQDLDLYGQTLQVEVRHKIRDHQEFSSKTDLIRQIEQDVESIFNRLEATSGMV